MNPLNQQYTTMTSDETVTKLHAKPTGLTTEEVNKRHKEFGLNVIHKRTINAVEIFIRQFKGNPLIIVLLAATTIAYLLGQHVSSYYIFTITLVSIVLGFWNEYSSEKTVRDLLKKISPSCIVLRNNEKFEISVSQLTIGDIVLLVQGSVVPADIRLIETHTLSIDESTLTGETKAAEKAIEPLKKETKSISDMTNIAFMGTVVTTGSGKGIVIAIGHNTEYGKISEEVLYTKPETEFQKALARFSQLLIKVIFILTAAIFIINALLGHPILDSIIFAIAIAVGITPELLPVIVTISLSHGAGKLAKKDVIVKQLIAIENLGNMDVLCTDKTGTLTEGKIHLVDYFDDQGKKNPLLITYSLLCNSAIVHHKIFGEPNDVAVWAYAQEKKIITDKDVIKLAEQTWDFAKRMMYTVVSDTNKTTIIVRGAPEEVLNASTTKQKKEVLKKFTDLSNDGYRVAAVAYKNIEKKKNYDWHDADNLTFLGLVTFMDIPKKSAKEALQKLHALNVMVKVITGDNEIITKKVCTEVGLDTQDILLGSDIDKLSDQELQKKVNAIEIFAKASPQQKLRIIKALRANGHTVGYIGDGINDVPSLHSADVGISVNGAVDVAKDTASVVLLHKSLDVIADGIREGRKIFNNTIKYILMSTSSNFGNMFSASIASFFLPFLPMTATQILVINGLYDISQTTIPSDNVDKESLVKPRHWNISFIKNYMLFFGPLSSIYDILTFGIMLYIFHAKGSLFQTGWFIESLATEILVVFVIRTAKVPFFKSVPGTWLAITCLSILGIGILLPYTFIAKSIGLVPPPPLFFAILIILVSTYLLLVEICKKFFLKRYSL